MNTEIIKAPFPYFGGKSKIAPLIWERFGRVDNYVEPFFGSGAMLLARPDGATTETVNDKDGLLANFWRALKVEPERVAEHADWPVNENDLHARHAWLVGQKDSLQSRLEGSPDYYDCKIAGWWVWGMACWIGSGFCSGRGPWGVREIDGIRQLVHLGSEGQGVNRKLVHLGDEGQGVNRKLVHLGDEGRGNGISRQMPSVRGDNGGSGQGINKLCVREDLLTYFCQLSERLRFVRVCCGNWSRVCGPSVTFKHGLTAVFLDPPYADTAGRTSKLYRMDCERVAHEAREWAINNGSNPLLRIALCGYEGEHQMPEDWDCVAWNAGEGFGGQAEERSENGKRERIWLSPNCLKATQEQKELF